MKRWFRSTKRWGSVGLALVLAVALTAPSASAGNTQHFNFKGSLLNAFWSDGNSATSVNIITNTQGAPPAFLFFSQLLGCDDTGCRSIHGFGGIPADSVRVTPGNASVSVNTATLPDYIVIESFCPTIPPETGPSCIETPGVGGIVELSFTRKGPPNSFRTSNTKTKEGNFMFQVQEQTRWSLALVTGSAFSFPAPANTVGEFSTSSTVIMAITKQ
jgi:hypothetical protein